jgi:hypothetical protein
MRSGPTTAEYRPTRQTLLSAGGPVQRARPPLHHVLPNPDPDVRMSCLDVAQQGVA